MEDTIISEEGAGIRARLNRIEQALEARVWANVEPVAIFPALRRGADQRDQDHEADRQRDGDTEGDHLATPPHGNRQSAEAHSRQDQIQHEVEAGHLAVIHLLKDEPKSSEDEPQRTLRAVCEEARDRRNNHDEKADGRDEAFQAAPPISGPSSFAAAGTQRAVNQCRTEILSNVLSVR